MKNIRPVFMFVLFTLVFLTGMSLAAQNRRLILYTWEDMFPQDILDGFTRSTGIEVVYKTFEFNEDMLMELEITEGGGYDLVIADDYIIEFVIYEGLARKLDKSRMANFSNINPLYQYQFYDPENEYTVPYGAGVQSIVYDPVAVGKEIKGFGDLWDSSLRDRLGITANYRVINGMALKTLGKSYNTENVGDIQAAGVKLNELVPNIRVFRDVDMDKALASGEIAAAVMYTGEATRLLVSDFRFKEVFPQEGVAFGIQAAFIPKEAPNAGGAYAFLDYIMDPRRGARCFEYNGYYCTFSGSQPFISPAYRDRLILPPLRDIEMIENIGRDAENAHFLAWKSFKAALKQQ
jgi:spermidine/putrescine-binding protein